MAEMDSKKFSLSLFSNNREVVPGDAGNVLIARDETVCPLQLLVYCSLRIPEPERLSPCYGRRKWVYEWSSGRRWDQLAWSAVQGLGMKEMIPCRFTKTDSYWEKIYYQLLSQWTIKLKPFEWCRAIRAYLINHTALVAGWRSQSTTLSPIIQNATS